MPSGSLDGERKCRDDCAFSTHGRPGSGGCLLVKGAYTVDAIIVSVLTYDGELGVAFFLVSLQRPCLLEQYRKT